MKTKYKEKLQQDLIKYSKQIGILDDETPRMVLDRKEYRELLKSKKQYHDRIGGWGQCNYPTRSVFIDGSKKIEWERVKSRKGDQLYVWDDKYNRYVKWIKRRKTRYKDFLITMIEELVHYRFAYIPEGKRLDKRINEVLRGKTFEPKHVHLYSHMPARYRKNLEKKMKERK